MNSSTKLIIPLWLQNEIETACINVKTEEQKRNIILNIVHNHGMLLSDFC